MCIHILGDVKVSPHMHKFVLLTAMTLVNHSVHVHINFSRSFWFQDYTKMNTYHVLFTF